MVEPIDVLGECPIQIAGAAHKFGCFVLDCELKREPEPDGFEEYVTVVSGRRAVTVHSWGNWPMYMDKDGNYLPNGYRASSKYFGRTLIGDVRVTNNNVEYRFGFVSNDKYQKGFLNCKYGKYCKSPTSALDDVMCRVLRHRKYPKGQNGKIILGLCYKEPQERIQQIFNITNKTYSL
jgi:hypothetical protein